MIGAKKIQGGQTNFYYCPPLTKILYTRLGVKHKGKVENNKGEGEWLMGKNIFFNPLDTYVQIITKQQDCFKNEDMNHLFYLPSYKGG